MKGGGSMPIILERSKFIRKKTNAVLPSIEFDIKKIKKMKEYKNIQNMLVDAVFDDKLQEEKEGNEE